MTPSNFFVEEILKFRLLQHVVKTRVSFMRTTIQKSQRKTNQDKKIETVTMRLALLSLMTGYAAAFVAGPTSHATFLARSSSAATSKPTFIPLSMVTSLDKEAPNGAAPSSSSPQALISNLLDGLLNDPDTHKQMKFLLNSSTHKWQSKIYDAIGAPASADEDMVADALAHAMQKVDNQFAILLGKAEDYEMTFPSDTVSYNDETCWLECRLYDKKDGELLVVSGWDLHLNPVTGAWLIDRIDWQDFRDEFYPGLGREEWCRAFV